MANRILLVDDEIDILDMLGDFLTENGYEIETATNGLDALEKLDKAEFDLLLSDINMPKMKGFELISKARKQHPSLKCALITAYNVNDYIRMARDEDVGNIIVKTSPFNYDEVLSMVRNLITEEVFGLSRYMSPGTEIHEFEVRQAKEIDDSIQKVNEFFSDKETGVKLNLSLREMVTNAVFYGARNELGDEKEKWDIEFSLKPDEYVKVNYAKDHEKLAAAVVDQKGRLKKKDVLFWLDRNITRGPEGYPLSLHDIHGRGIYISRETIDRLIINIKPDIKTEVIIMHFYSGQYQGYKPLLINEFRGSKE